MHSFEETLCHLSDYLPRLVAVLFMLFPADSDARMPRLRDESDAFKRRVTDPSLAPLAPLLRCVMFQRTNLRLKRTDARIPQIET